jgi:Tfp pilus assembly protein PilF
MPPRAVRPALADLNKALALNPAFSRPIIARADIYLRRGRSDLSLADLDKAVAVAPKEAQGYVARAEFYSRKGQDDLAMTDLDAALALDPRSANAFCQRALIHMKQGRADLAAADLDRALAIDPNHILALFNRAMEYLNTDRTVEAVAGFTAVIALAPGHDGAYMMRASPTTTSARCAKDQSFHPLALRRPRQSARPQPPLLFRLCLPGAPSTTTWGGKTWPSPTSTGPSPSTRATRSPTPPRSAFYEQNGSTTWRSPTTQNGRA